MWDLPAPGLEPVCPALAGGFLTTVPPGKSPEFILRDEKKKRDGKNNTERGARGWSSGLRDSSPGIVETGSDQEVITSKTTPRAEGLPWGL